MSKSPFGDTTIPHGLALEILWYFWKKSVFFYIVSRNYFCILKKSLDYRSNHRILKLPMSLYCKNNYNCRFFVCCKIITIKEEGLFFSLFFFTILSST